MIINLSLMGACIYPLNFKKKKTKKEKEIKKEW